MQSNDQQILRQVTALFGRIVQIFPMAEVR
jgi:hypothetical protein